MTRGQVGVEMSYELRISSARSSRSQLVLHDRVTNARPVVIESLGKREVAIATVLARPDARGWYEDPPIEIECAAPLGLWSTRRLLPCKGSVEIAPEMPLVRLPWRKGGQDPLAEGLTEPPRRGSGLDFLGLREYRVGDPVRHIHWISSARRDELTVREFQQEGVRPILVIPDLSQPVAIAERAISVAGAIVREAVSQSVPVYLRLADGRVLESPNAALLASELARMPLGGEFPSPASFLTSRRWLSAPLVLGISASVISELGPVGAIVLIGAERPVESKYPIWWASIEGELCLTASSMPFAA